MKYIAFTCFSLVYLVALYRPAIDLVFVMAFPIVIVFVLYYDFKLMSIMSATFMTITLWDCIKLMFIMKKHHSGLPLNSSVLLMEFLATGIFLGATTIVTRISKQNNDEKIHEIQTVADRVNTSIKEINVEIGTLNDSSIAAKHAMEEINSGISSAAEAVQNQLLQTEAIQDRIENVQEATDKIDQNVDLATSVVATGRDDVATLVAQADRSVLISEKVIQDLNSLKTSINAMSGITQMIESIAFQTNIMALNANVEAAHAGDSGRGFAVVATEISNMSTQTKEATDNVSDLIHNATISLDDLVASVTEMSSVIQSEKDQTMQTSEIFGTIQNSTEEVRNHVSLFIDYIFRQFSFHRNQPFANTNVTNSFSYIQEDTIMITNNQEKENQNANQSTNTAMPQSEPNKADSVDLSSALPRAALDEIPECKADAVSITGLVKKSGRVAGYQLSDNRIVSREEGVSLAKAGEIKGVGIAHKKSTEYLKSIPDGSQDNNLSSLPTVKTDKTF